MTVITSDPSCFELSDDGTNEPESDVSCTSAAVAVPSLLTRLKQSPVAAANFILL